MKKLFTLAISSLLLAIPIFAQKKTKVTAFSSDISDNLDLKAVASIFGDASNLEDFEKRLNDPKAQITNLDLNNDNLVDYLRVVELVDNRAHIIVIQAIIDKDIYQDVVTIELEKNQNNKIQIQVIGDVYMYGNNYIYEPIYAHTPVIYKTFWVNHYRPYCSSWYWGYYPSYYSYWNPYPIFKYKNHISLHINFGHSYNYGFNRRCETAYYSYYGKRGDGFEMRNPNRSFTNRNRGFSNKYEMDNHRKIKTHIPRTLDLNTNVGLPRNVQPREIRSIDNPRSLVAKDNFNESSSKSISQPRNIMVSVLNNNPRNISQPRTNTISSSRSERQRRNFGINLPSSTPQPKMEVQRIEFPRRNRNSLGTNTPNIVPTRAINFVSSNEKRR